MESDLSLIEMSGEDVSLVEQSSFLSSNNDIPNFGCSPLHLSTSLTSAIIMNADAGVPSCSSSYSNKENLNISDHKSALPTLSVEPQKMKRSKKGSGYNLRKSLAWDRAFLTEEGVLNPTELSMISGSVAKSDEDHLLFIDKEGRDLSSLNSDSTGDIANLKTLEENLFKELPSNYSNGRSTTNCSFLEQDSLTGRSLAGVSESSEKIPPRHIVSKSALKGGVASCPATSASQKRILTMGSTQVTRISKVPKFPSARQDDLPHIAANRISTGQSSSKPVGIPDSAAQKSVNLKGYANIKNVGPAKASLKGMPKSTNSSMESTRKDVAKSILDLHRSKMSNLLEYISNKEHRTSRSNVVDSICGISRPTVSPHSSSAIVSGAQKEVQGKGLKPSGLRKPSPSLRFFSEPKVPVLKAPSKYDMKPSNLPKPSILTFDKIRFRVEMIDKCSSLTNAEPTALGKASEGEHDQKVAMAPIQTDKDETMCGILHDSNTNCKSHVLASLENEVRDSKGSDLLLSRIDSGEGNHSVSSIIQGQTVDESISESCSQPSHEAELIDDFERYSKCSQLVEGLSHISSTTDHKVMIEAQPEGTASCSMMFDKQERWDQSVGEFQQPHVDVKHGDAADDSHLSIRAREYLNVQDDLAGKDDSLLRNGDFLQEEFPVKFKDHGGKDISNASPEVAKDMRCKSSAMNDLVMLEFEIDSVIHQNNKTQHADCGQSIKIVLDQQLLVTSNICSYSQEVSEGVTDVHIGGQNLSLNGTSSLKLDEDDHDVWLCEDGIVPFNKSDRVQPFTPFESEGMGSCSINRKTAPEHNDSMLVECQHHCVDDIHGGIIVGGDFSCTKISETSEVDHDDVSSKDDSLLHNSALFKGEQLFVEGKNHGEKEASIVSLEAQAQRGLELKGKSSASNFSLFEVLTENPIEVHDSFASRGGNVQSHSFHRYGMTNSHVSDRIASLEDKHCTEVTDDISNEVNKKHIFKNELAVKEPMAQCDDIDSIDAILLAKDSPKSDDIERPVVIVESNYQECESPVEVEEQADSLPLLLNNENDSTTQAHDLELPTSTKGDHNLAECPAADSDTEDEKFSSGRNELQPKNVHSKNAIEQCSEHDRPGSNISQTKCETIVSEHVHGFVNENKCHKRATNCTHDEVQEVDLGTCPDAPKQVGAPPNATPFSDEWLAAIEAAGEEILTLKTGAVQHSPPDKLIPEPSPWSLVKRKSNQVIGPFDCTKYMNGQP